MKIITTEDLDGMPKGSVVQDAEEVVIAGTKYWRGMWSSMCGSYIVDIPQRAAEVWIEEKHDLISRLFKLLKKEKNV